MRLAELKKHPISRDVYNSEAEGLVTLSLLLEHFLQ